MATEKRVIVVKGAEFQGADEEWSNQYTLTAMGAWDPEAAANSIVNIERLVHGLQVQFRQVRVYDVGLASEDIEYLEDLSVSGQAEGRVIYRECAILVSWPLPRGGVFGFGRPRFLRKWLHVDQIGGSAGPASEGQAAGTTALNADIKARYIANYADLLTAAPHGGGVLSAPNGDVPIGPASVFDYVEHRQFHRGT